MATITTPGASPDAPTPWYTTAELTCVHCNAGFTLDFTDLDVSGDPGALWSLEVDPGLSGMTEVHGPCPNCRTPIAFVRPNAAQQGMVTPIFSRLYVPFVLPE